MTLQRTGVLAALVAVGVLVFLTMASSAWAASTICVPEQPSKPVVSTNTKGECPPKGKLPIKYKLVEVGGEGKEGKEGPEGKNALTAEEQAVLKAILPHTKYVASGVGGKPTIKFSGVNLQVVNGLGETSSVNGEGNLVIGYDENSAERTQTGSHNLILGEQQMFTSFGGILGGVLNAVTAPYASVSGGAGNTASGEESSVSGGANNTASGVQSSVTGGFENTASGEGSSVSDGNANTASAGQSSVSGGADNTASGDLAWVGGGFKNNAEASLSSIFGGKLLKAKNEFEAIP
jgi:hypothetical protein